MSATFSVFGSIRECFDLLYSGQLSVVDLIRLELERIEQIDDKLNSFIVVNERSLDDASSAQQVLSRGDPVGPLHGIPVAIKDLIFTRGMDTSAGSRVRLGNSQVAEDAAVVARLKRAGAIIIGKNNLHEFAFGITNENEHFGPVLNPWNMDRMSGGSSGGSAASVSAGLCYAAIGTDTRGSIRIPSACCGVAGFKPSRGKVSTAGVIPLSTSLDHVGPIARTVDDLAVLNGIIADTSVKQAQPCPPPDALRLGISDYYFRNITPEVEQAVTDALTVFEDYGARVERVDMDILDDSLHASDIISRAEAVTYHDRNLQTQRNHYGPKVRSRLETGYSVSGIELVTAQKIQQATCEAFDAVFKKVDYLIAPALPVTAPPLSTEHITIGEISEPIVHCFVRLNAPQNVAGIPALAFPCGFDKSDLPIGVQVIGPKEKDVDLLELGKFFQSRTTWHTKQHSLSDHTLVSSERILHRLRR